MPRVVHFEIHAEDPDRVVGFYAELFGWRFDKWAGPVDYWLVTTGPDGQPGINGGLIRRQGPRPVAAGQPVNAYVCTVDVPDLDQYLARATHLGATVVVPRMPIPGVGWLAYVTDPDGNILGLTQADPAAR
jgi:predicted enzyme related to lactoylglutathione lyase